MVLLQFFEEIDEGMLFVDEIGCTLEIVRLKWQQRLVHICNEFAFMPPEFVREHAHFVGKDVANDTLNGSCPRKAKQVSSW